MNTIVYVLVPVAYLLGTFPSAIMVARSKGIDITTVGSGNPGASNIARTLGAKWGIAVFAMDALKGAVPAAVGLLLDTRPGAYVLVAAAVLGHMYPVTRGFRGGKGVATLGGATIVLHPWCSPRWSCSGTWCARPPRRRRSPRSRSSSAYPWGWR